MSFVPKLLANTFQNSEHQDLRALARRLCAHSDGSIPLAQLEKALCAVPAPPEVAGLLQHDAREALDDAQVRAAWDFYGELCRAFWLAHEPQPRPQEDKAFGEEHFHEGQFPSDAALRFAREALASPTIPFQIEDSAAGYYYNNSTVVPLVDTYNQIFVFRALSSAAMEALKDCLLAIEPVVTRCLRGYWRVVQVRYWETKPGGEGIGTNGWHTDGFPLDAVKILSFFSEVDERKGTTRFKKRDGSIHTFRGPAGKWILFRNSVVEHAGLPPEAGQGNRLTVETTIAPALATDVRPVFAGINGHYPYVPWFELRGPRAA